MANLTGQEIRNTYQGLLKTDDNDAFLGPEKVITDGLGNASAISLGTYNLKITGGLLDVAGSSGNFGQVLSSTGLTDPSGFPKTQWISIPEAVFEAGSGANSIQNALGPYTGTASGTFSMAVFNSTASNYGSVSIGMGLINAGERSTAFGANNQITGTGLYSFVAGAGNTVSSAYSAAFGGYNTASGYYSFATGGYSNASGFYSVAMGFASTASGTYSTALNASAEGTRSFAAASGFTTSSAYNGISMGYGTQAQGQYSVAIGGSMSFIYTDAIGDYSIAMGAQATASGKYSTAIGAGNVQFGGANPNALGDGSVAMGMFSTASGYYSLALQGGGATGNSSLAINKATASGYYAVAISSGTDICIAAGEQSFAIGVSCQANAAFSGVIGNGIASHDKAICINANSNRGGAVHVNELSIMDIPTSAAGLPSGAVWSNAGVLNIVP